jgi:hypothetical protein
VAWAMLPGGSRRHIVCFAIFDDNKDRSLMTSVMTFTRWFLSIWNTVEINTRQKNTGYQFDNGFYWRGFFEFRNI